MSGAPPGKGRTPRPGWDAAVYDSRFSFVTSLGAPLLDLLDARPGDRILDLGCGTGHQAAELAARGWSVTGIDADAVCRHVRAALAPGGRFVAELGGRGNVAALTRAIQSARADLGLGPAGDRWYFPSPAEHAGRLEAAGFTVRMIERYERPTPLAPGDTAADWARMFGQALLDHVPEGRRAEFDAAVDAHATAAGLRGPDGTWTADYVRVRFIAVAA